METYDFVLVFSVPSLAARIVWKKNLIRQLLEAQLQLPETIWVRLNAAWALFFMLMV